MKKTFIWSFSVLFSVLSAIFLPKHSLIKYLPVTLFSSSVVLCEVLYFTTNNLLKVKNGLKGIPSIALLLVFGPYFFVNLWVFHLSKGKFHIYALINFIGDLVYAFPLITLFKKLNFFKMKVTSIQFFTLIYTNALINFVFQKFYERIYKKYNSC